MCNLPPGPKTPFHHLHTQIQATGMDGYQCGGDRHVREALEVLPPPKLGAVRVIMPILHAHEIRWYSSIHDRSSTFEPLRH